LQLDSFTVLVAGCSLLVLLGAVLVVLWLRDRAAPWLLWWGLPFMLGGLALTQYLSPTWDSDLWSITIGNAMRMFMIGCFWIGIRVFQRRPTRIAWLVAYCCAWMLISLIPAVNQSLAARIIIVSLMNAGLAGLAALELWRHRDEELGSRWPALLVFSSFGLIMVIRAAIAPFVPFPVGAGRIDALWLAVFSWIILGHAVFAAVLFLTMTMERRVAEQRNFALSDPLTNLMNRRAFADFAQRTNRRRAGLRNALALLVLDLDHFKTINDRFGHEVGDRLLKAFAEVAEASVRPSDQLFRMGGEEFCFALPETALADAIAVAERVRKAFEAASVETADGPAATTVSVGIAATQHSVDVEVLLAAADAAMYEAKARGRNRVVVAEPASLLRAQLADIAGPKRASA
jgi:diguanylate cyclase (GGDEF)-like protein